MKQHVFQRGSIPCPAVEVHDGWLGQGAERFAHLVRSVQQRRSPQPLGAELLVDMEMEQAGLRLGHAAQGIRVHTNKLNQRFAGKTGLQCDRHRAKCIHILVGESSLIVEPGGAEHSFSQPRIHTGPIRSFNEPIFRSPRGKELLLEKRQQLRLLGRRPGNALGIDAVRTGELNQPHPARARRGETAIDVARQETESLPAINLISRFSGLPTELRQRQHLAHDAAGLVARRRSMMPSAERSNSATTKPRARTEVNGSRSRWSASSR